MAWVLLVSAGLIEIVMAAALKASNGWSRPLPGLVGLLAGFLSIVLLTHAIKSLPTGTAYAIWTGIGAVGVTLLGMVSHGDSASPWRVGCIALIVVGIAGLRLLEA
ncbi:MAG: multidrug efflux SMR transporter [Burkholderiales bacterium]|nr:MAG: multidrug efflux SMR transporter [Burkholderiales bacterium]